MEPIQGKLKTSKVKQDDFINTMPKYVVTNILNRLPLKDAIRTSILSKNWRFKWTILLSQVVLDNNFFNSYKDAKEKPDFCEVIYKFLLRIIIRGSVTKFVLSIDEACYSVNFLEKADINFWISILSIKEINDITLEKENGKPLKLSTTKFSIFSCSELTHLKLVNCCFDPPVSYHGFPNLLSLELCHVRLKGERYVKFFTESPKLEILRLSYPSEVLRSGSVNCTGEVKLAEIAKLANLKELSLILCMIDDMDSSTIFELMSSLPKLQKLVVSFINCEDVALMLGICSPNTMMSSQLHSVVLKEMKGSENEVCLIEWLLGSSPFLEKIAIHFNSFEYFGHQQNKFLRKLLNLQQAYPAVDIDLPVYN